jgi:hypothetical protein
MLVSEGATSTAPTADTSFTPSKIGSQVVPALVVFQIPAAGIPA